VSYFYGKGREGKGKGEEEGKGEGREGEGCVMSFGDGCPCCIGHVFSQLIQSKQ